MRLVDVAYLTILFDESVYGRIIGIVLINTSKFGESNFAKVRKF